MSRNSDIWNVDVKANVHSETTCSFTKPLVRTAIIVFVDEGLKNHQDLQRMDRMNPVLKDSDGQELQMPFVKKTGEQEL